MAQTPEPNNERAEIIWALVVISTVAFLVFLRVTSLHPVFLSEGDEMARPQSNSVQLVSTTN